MCEDFARVVGCVGHWRRLIEWRIRCGNPEYAHGILHDIRNFVRSVREEYLEYCNSKLEDLPHAQATQMSKGRRLGSDPPAAAAAASGIQIKHGRLETGQPRSESSSVLEGPAKRARVFVRCAWI